LPIAVKVRAGEAAIQGRPAVQAAAVHVEGEVRAGAVEGVSNYRFINLSFKITLITSFR